MIKEKVQKFGKFLSGMKQCPNIEDVIAWGLIAAYIHRNRVVS